MAYSKELLCQLMEESGRVCQSIIGAFCRLAHPLTPALAITQRKSPCKPPSHVKYSQQEALTCPSHELCERPLGLHPGLSLSETTQ